MSCLRPSPPLRPCLALGHSDAARRSGRTASRKHIGRSFEEDAQILRIIEAYCTSARTRYTVNSAALLDCPQVLIAEEEKIIIEETAGNETIVEEKSLVDTVYALKDQVKTLQDELGSLSLKLEAESKARGVLQQTLRMLKIHFSSVNGEDIVWPED